MSAVFDPVEKSGKSRKGRKAVGGSSASQIQYLPVFFPCTQQKAHLVVLTECLRYYTRADAEHAMRFINGTRLDDRIIRTDWDAGFKEGRQYGRGKTGGQVKAMPVHP